MGSGQLQMKRTDRQGSGRVPCQLRDHHAPTRHPRSRVRAQASWQAFAVASQHRSCDVSALACRDSRLLQPSWPARRGNPAGARCSSALLSTEDCVSRLPSIKWLRGNLARRLAKRTPGAAGVNVEQISGNSAPCRHSIEVTAAGDPATGPRRQGRPRHRLRC